MKPSERRLVSIQIARTDFAGSDASEPDHP